jgi:hypothetical protein
VTAVDTQSTGETPPAPTDPSELQSKISQDADPAGEETPPEGSDTAEVPPTDEVPPSDDGSKPDEQSDDTDADADAAMDAFNKSFDDEGDTAPDTTDGESVPPEGGDIADDGSQEPPKRSHHKKEEGEGDEASGESSGDEPKRSHHKKEPEAGEKEPGDDEDDDVSVIIHPKKKKVTESVEDDKALTATASLFQVMGLDSQYSIVGAKMESLTAKRILAILGFIGIPGSMLVKIENLEESVNEHGQTISANALTRTNFTKIFHSIIETQKSEKFTDVEYRTEFTKFLSLLGIDLSAIKSSRQAVSAVLFGAYCISSNPEAKVAFHAFMDNFEETTETTETTETKPVNESKDHDEDDEDGYRTYDKFAHLMRTSGSTYRDWMPVKDQRELANWYCGGGNVHVIISPEDEDPNSHVPAGYSIYATSKADEHGLVEVICLEKPSQVIRY